VSRTPLKGTDYVYEEPPWWAVGPLKAVAMDLIYDEAHAALLGLVGIPMALAWAAGLTEEVAGLTLVLVAVAFGLRKAPNSLPVARRVLRKEPWYFTTVLVAALVLSLTVVEVVA